MPPFVACPSCTCPAKTSESHCPSCGAALRSADGAIARTAIAVVLGLTAAAALGGCSAGASAPKYGVPATDGEVQPEPTATGSQSAQPPPDAPPREPENAPMYGVPATPDK